MENTSIADQLSTSSHQLSPRAKAIARGLRRTGRVAGTIGLDVDDRWVTLPATSDRFYFIATDGSQLRRGEDASTADELQPGFLDAMARVGAKIAEAGGWS